MTGADLVPRLLTLLAEYPTEETVDALLIVALVGGLADDLPAVLRQRLEVLASGSRSRLDVRPMLVDAIVDLLESSVSAAKDSTTQAARRMFGSPAPRPCPPKGGGMNVLAIRAQWSRASDDPGSG